MDAGHSLPRASDFSRTIFRNWWSFCRCVGRAEWEVSGRSGSAGWAIRDLTIYRDDCNDDAKTMLGGFVQPKVDIQRALCITKRRQTDFARKKTSQTSHFESVCGCQLCFMGRGKVWGPRGWGRGVGLRDLRLFNMAE